MIPIRPGPSAPPFPAATPAPSGAHLITLHAGRRGAPLNSVHLASEFHAAVHLLALERWWRVRCAVLLPRTAHLVATLAAKIGPTEAADELKRRLAPCLRRARQTWLPGHQARFLSDAAEIANALRALYLEPSRAGLCAEGDAWPGYLCADEDRSWLASVATNSTANATAPGASRINFGLADT